MPEPQSPLSLCALRNTILMHYICFLDRKCVTSLAQLLMDTLEPEESNVISEEERELLTKEESELATTLASLKEQMTARDQLLRAEDQRSRTLTAELVAATRDEDKQMLASDEAVSHALKQNHSGEAKNLSRLLEKPYFARFVIEEEKNGKPVQFEYKLGYSSNPDCRIIDWRKSPLSKLYYEYREGDEYCEEIQGREREGSLILRHPIRIEDGEVKGVTCRFGTFSKEENGWVRSGSKAQGKGGIRNVLPLITPEQFRTITEDAKTAVLIQGIAGSGKTTVALHRLAWLLHENNSDFSSEECAVIVRNEVLAEFIKHTLAAIEIEGTPIFTFHDWQEKVRKSLAPELEVIERIDPTAPIPKGLTVFIHSEQFFRVFEAVLHSEEKHLSSASLSNFWSILTETFVRITSEQRGNFQLLGIDSGKVFEYLTHCKGSGEKIPEFLLTAHLRFLLECERKRSASLSPPLQFKHLVADELQDYSLLSLSCLVNAVRETTDLTLVGDVGQALSEDYDFVGWERLKEVWNIDLGEHAKFFTLEVSHRSTFR